MNKMPGVLDQTSSNEYVLTGENVWITVNNLSVNVRRTDEGVVVDIYPLDREDEGTITSTYAFFAEAEVDDENDL